MAHRVRDAVDRDAVAIDLAGQADAPRRHVVGRRARIVAVRSDHLGIRRAEARGYREQHAATERTAAAEMVRARELGRRDGVLLGDVTQGLALAHAVAHGQVDLRQFGALTETALDDLALALGHAHGGNAVRTGEHGGARRRIQLPQLLIAAVRELRDRTQIDHALQRDFVEAHGVVEFDVTEAVLDRVARDRERGHELRHIRLGLLREAQLPIVRRALVFDGTHDRALAGVVGRQRQRPVTEDPVQVLQVARRGDRGLLGILALVDPLVDVQPEQARGRTHELPRPHGRGIRARVDVEAALDEHEMHQIGRQAFLLEHIAEQLHVAARALEPAFERAAAGPGEERDVLEYVGVHLELDVLDGRLIEDGGLARGLRRLGGRGGGPGDRRSHGRARALARGRRRRVDQARDVRAGGVRCGFGGMQRPDRQRAPKGRRQEDGVDALAKLHGRTSSALNPASKLPDRPGS